MAIRRACSYQANIKTPEPPGNYLSILVTFQQQQQNMFNLDTSQLVIGDEMVTVQLDQDQTRQFVAGIPAFLQIRAFKSQYEAPGSRIWTLDVFDALNDEVLP